MCSFFRADHEDGAVSVADDVFGDAAQDGSSQSALAPAAYHHDPRAEFFAEIYDLLCRAAKPQVGSGDRTARGPDVLRLLLEQPLGVVPELDRLLLSVGEECGQVLADVDHVQIRTRPLAELYR